MKTFIEQILESGKVYIKFSSGDSMTFGKPLKNSTLQLDNDSIFLSHNDKDYFVNLKFVDYVCKSIRS